MDTYITLNQQASRYRDEVHRWIIRETIDRGAKRRCYGYWHPTGVGSHRGWQWGIWRQVLGRCVAVGNLVFHMELHQNLIFTALFSCRRRTENRLDSALWSLLPMIINLRSMLKGCGTKIRRFVMVEQILLIILAKIMAFKSEGFISVEIYKLLRYR